MSWPRRTFRSQELRHGALSIVHNARGCAPKIEGSLHTFTKSQGLVECASELDRGLVAYGSLHADDEVNRLRDSNGLSRRKACVEYDAANIVAEDSEDFGQNIGGHRRALALSVFHHDLTCCVAMS